MEITIINGKPLNISQRTVAACKNDQVLWIGAPELDKMHGIPEAQAGMTAKHDTRLPVLGVHYLILRNKYIKFYARIRILENAAKL